MKIVNTGSVRIRIEGYGYAAPGESITVPDDTGRSLCAEGSDFQEIKKPLSGTEISLSVAKKSLPEVKKIKPKRSRKIRQKKIKVEGTEAQRHKGTETEEAKADVKPAPTKIQGGKKK